MPTPMLSNNMLSLSWPVITVPKKPKVQRSRGGCSKCKERRTKCNERRPSCARCIDRGLTCEYPPIQPRRRRTDKSSSGGGVTKRSSVSSNSPISPTNANFYAELKNLDNLRPIEPKREAVRVHPILLPNVNMGQYLEEDASSTSGSDTGTGGTISPELLFHPSYADFSPSSQDQSLIAHFCNHLSTLLVFRDHSSNPFRSMLLPYWADHEPIRNAILAVSSLHLEQMGCPPRGEGKPSLGLGYHSLALEGLVQMVESPEVDGTGPGQKRMVILGVIVLLIYFEVVQSGVCASILTHLRGAYHVLSLCRSDPETADDPGLSFLEKILRYFEVICALSSSLPPISTIEELALSMDRWDTEALLSHPPLHHSDPLIAGNVDLIFGLVTHLWPLLHRLASAVSFAETNFQLNLPLIGNDYSDLQELETELTSWSLPAPTTQALLDINPDPKLIAIANTAEAYRQAALIHLYRHGFNFPVSSSSVQSAVSASLEAVRAVMAFSGPMSALLWPVFMTACESCTLENQAAATVAFQKLQSVQRMKNISASWSIVQTVWARRIWDGDCVWRDVLDEGGVDIVLG